MILSRFFKPKWQHTNPDVRKAALKSLSTSDPALVQAAREDDNPGVRRAAIFRITDLDLLLRIAEEDPEVGVRETAEARFRKLMSGQEPGGPSLESRIVVIARTLPLGAADFLAVQGAEAQLRLAVLDRVEQAPVLAELAIHDPAVDVRIAALQRIREEELLKRVLKHTRKSDKRVHRIARTRLEELRTVQKHQARALELCVEMESMAAELGSEPNAGHFQKVEESWQTEHEAASTEIQERYLEAREQYLARLQKSAVRRREQREGRKVLEQLLKRLQDATDLSPELAAAIEDALSSDDADTSAPTDSDDPEHFQLVSAIRDRQRLLQRNQHRSERLHTVLRDAEALLQQTSEVLESDLTRLEQQWGSLERPETQELTGALRSEFDAALGQLRSRLQRQGEQRDQELQDIEQLIGALENALAEGTLQRAISLRDQARYRIKDTIGLSRKQLAAMEDRLHACSPKLGELRGWRRWGTHRAREGLCEDVEGMTEATAAPDELAHQIKAARAAWKTMDRAEGPAPKALWERFDSACEKAYAPCQAYFDEKARERQRNFERRQAVCDRLARMESDTDWENVDDWRSLDRAWHDAQKQWRKLGPVGRREKGALQKRYREIIEVLNDRLDVERHRDLQRRQALIEELQQLTKEEPLARAIDRAKRAQAEWHPTVQGPRPQEQAMWREFRAACDAIFERREAEQLAAAKEREANLAERTSICAELEALSIAEGTELNEASERVSQLKVNWENAGPVPRTAQQGIERRYNKALERFNDYCRDQLRRRDRSRLDQLRERARVCARLESLVPEANADPIPALNEAAEAWKLAPALPADLEKAMQRRFDAACEALQAKGAARETLAHTLAENMDVKKHLCLQMEIMAGVETPPEFAKDRMDYKVARLAESFTSGSPEQAADDAGEAFRIEQAWYATGGASPTELSQQLESRFERAVAAFHGDVNGER